MVLGPQGNPVKYDLHGKPLKNMTESVKIEAVNEEVVVLGPQGNPVKYDLHGKPLDENYPPLPTDEQKQIIKDFVNKNPDLGGMTTKYNKYFPPPCNRAGSWEYDPEITWIQTYTGRRFTPTKPLVDAIVLEDIAHPLSMQCRFSGHTNFFYSVAQHSVLVSYICDEKCALYGLLHDASEAYIVDIPRPIKKSLKEYVDLEKLMQEAICERFGLEKEMPESVKKADDLLLMTEARDLMSPLRDGWGYNHIKPLPFKIQSMDSKEAEQKFIERFCELTGVSAKWFGKNL